MNISASRTYIRMSPRKLREVADLIRGKDARSALASLQFVRRRAAEPMGVVLRQAIANATQNGVMGKLVISKLLVDEGPILKRFRPISKGQAHPIQKYTSHIKIELTPVALPAKTQQINKVTEKKETESATVAEKAPVVKEVKTTKTVKKVSSKTNK